MNPKTRPSRRGQLAAEGAGLSPLLRRQRPSTAALTSVGALLVIDVDVFGIDHVRGLLTATLFLGAGSGRSGTGASTGGLTGSGGLRSEEHTSELQSRRDLVCRLL